MFLSTVKSSDEHSIVRFQNFKPIQKILKTRKVRSKCIRILPVQRNILNPGIQNLISESTLVIDFGSFIDELDRFHAPTSSRDALG